MRRTTSLLKNWRTFSCTPYGLSPSMLAPASVSPMDVLQLILVVPRAPRLLAAEAWKLRSRPLPAQLSARTIEWNTRIAEQKLGLMRIWFSATPDACARHASD